VRPFTLNNTSKGKNDQRIREDTVSAKFKQRVTEIGSEQRIKTPTKLKGGKEEEWARTNQSIHKLVNVTPESYVVLNLKVLSKAIHENAEEEDNYNYRKNSFTTQNILEDSKKTPEHSTILNQEYYSDKSVDRISPLYSSSYSKRKLLYLQYQGEKAHPMND